MAVTTEGATLTGAYRRSQLAVRASVIKSLHAVWPLLDGHSLDASFPRYFAAASAIIRDDRHRSAVLTARYYEHFREAEEIAGLAPSVEIKEISAEQLAASLAVTGPSTVKRQLRLGFTLQQALRFGFAAQAGAASRLALDAGRGALDRYVQTDDTALGWARITSGHACAFCAMLASRGAVYKTRQSAGGGHRYHDHCVCVQEPVFGRNTMMTPSAERYRALWQQSTEGKSGKAAYNAFRSALESA